MLRHGQVLPFGEEKRTQKVAVGDQSGVIQSFSVKKGEIGLVFKTLPTSNKVTLLHGGRIVEAKARLRALCSVVRLGDPGMHAHVMHTYLCPSN